VIRFELLAPLVATDLFTAVVLSLTPIWVRPGTYFGVRVAPEYRHSPEAKRSQRRFRAAVWAATAVAVALTFAAPNTGIAGLLFQIVVAFVAFRSGWRDTRPHAIPAASTRTAHLFAARPRVPGGIAAVATPFVILAGVALYLRAHWDAIPARFPIHWDFDGHANGWSTRTVGGVFGPLLVACGVQVFLLSIAALQVYGGRRSPIGSGPERRTRAVLATLLIVTWTIAVMFSVVALTPLILRNGHFPIPMFVMLMLPLAGVAVGIWLMARANAEPDDTPADNTPDECWKWGWIYYNPNDPTLLVEKRFGLGYTFNFAHWQSWAVLGGGLLLPLAIIFITHHLH
jgi:uncharacterized membrane protein